MHNNLKDKRINGVALELIMRDVLQGMMQFTEQSCAGSSAANLEIQSIEAADNKQPLSSNNVIPFERFRKLA
jgi:hypothetical protein